MKKLFVILAAMGMMLAMTSCKKICECKKYLGKKPNASLLVDITVGLEDYKDYDVKRCSDLNKKVPEFKDLECR